MWKKSNTASKPIINLGLKSIILYGLHCCYNERRANFRQFLTFKASNTMIEHQNFLERFKGSFYGVLKWEQLDALWENVRRQPEGQWFVYQVGELPPESPATRDTLGNFLTHIDHLLRSEHKEDYCGIVYADDLQEPAFIKIFDPNNLGVSCGFSEQPPLPGWVLSKIPPMDLPHAFPPPQNRRRWWQRLFS